jgi:hypothetical protein
MEGIFGSYLTTASAIGGFILMLLIGQRAWSTDSLARWIRLILGSWIIGTLIGLVFVISGFYNPGIGYNEKPWWVFFPSIFVFIGFILEIINNAME